ncbi:hypothetical protein ADS78_12945, partial [Idiomarina abyssalis]
AQLREVAHGDQPAEPDREPLLEEVGHDADRAVHHVLSAGAGCLPRARRGGALARALLAAVLERVRGDGVAVEARAVGVGGVLEAFRHVVL